ncbi:MAG: hypothetical protein HOV81_03150 [Kofleriaceae bacterium]|nr:hypothetical protein [Kofleriaceae bacterium]
MITAESIDVDSSDPAFVRVRHVQIEDGVDMGGTLVIERASATHLADQLEAATTQYGYPGSETKLGADELRVYESGPEQRPIVNVINRRAAAAPNGGVYGLMMTAPYAKQLAKLLRALRN